jgi:hypothetical protein
LRFKFSQMGELSAVGEFVGLRVEEAASELADLLLGVAHSFVILESFRSHHDGLIVVKGDLKDGFCHPILGLPL